MKDTHTPVPMKRNAATVTYLFFHRHMEKSIANVEESIEKVVYVAEV